MDHAEHAPVPLEPVLLSPPDVGRLEQEYVAAAMASGWVAPAGPDLTRFEQEVASRVGVAHGVALASGTAGLHLALVAWGVGPGDTVPVSSLTFAASINAIHYVGATPYLIDSEEGSGNVSADLLADALAHLRATGARVPVIMPVDLLGKCVDLERVGALAEEYGAKLLCDAAESFGATHRGRPAGGFGAASVVSFNGNKIMTTSGGGMLLTDDAGLAEHVRKLATQAREPVAHYEHKEVGYNYRLSNLLAALGRAQLARLDAMLTRRRNWRERYRALLAGHPGVRILGGDDDGEDNCWLTAVIVDPEVSAWTAADLEAAMQRASVETRPLWKPMHLQPVWRDLPGSLDGTAERLFGRGLTLPSGSGMSAAAFARVEAVIEEVTGAPSL